MADKSFDVVIVGGGNKALITAMYLTKYGKLSVGIFEERHELGGGWCQEEPAPGFIGNPCSMGYSSIYHIPTYWDFPEWETYGAKLAYTKVAYSNCFIEDDTCFVYYTAYDDVDPTQEKTAANIARYSQKDADTWLYLWDKFKKYWDPALREHMFNPAKPMGEPDAMEKMLFNPNNGIDPIWMHMSEMQVFQDLFEDPHVANSCARGNQSLGWEWDQTGAGLGALFNTFFWFSTHCWVVGSSHSQAHAAQKVILENGGKVYTNYTVDKVIIENGKAKGIRLSDGTEIEAKKAVVTTIDPDQLCNKLIGKDYLSSKILGRVNRLERDWICLMWYTWAFNERPNYRAAAFNPDVDESMWNALGDTDLNTFKVESQERKAYKWPSKLNIALAYHGVSDVSPGDSLLAPPDINFTVLSEQFVVPAWALSEKEWKEKETEHAEAVIKQLERYTTNINWDKVSGYLPVTPFYTANQCKNYAPAGNWCVIDNTPAQFGKFRPIPELAGHRVPGIKGLYPTGSAWHPWGSAHSAQGYNCYKVMAEDLNLPKPWDVDGRPF